MDEATTLDIPAEELPEDARPIGSQTRIIQNLVIKRHNIKFTLKRYYSPSLQKTFIAKIEGDDGSKFGGDLRAFIDYLYYKLRVPHEKIREFLSEFEIDVSKGQLVNLLNSRSDEFIEELDGARESSLKMSKNHHIDETGHKLNNQSLYTFCFSNIYMTYLRTFGRKTKSEAMSSLFSKDLYCLNEAALGYLKGNTTILRKIKSHYLYSNKALSRKGFEEVLEKSNITKQERTKVLVAAMYGAYIAGKLGPPIKYLVTDDAPNLNFWKRHQLCWIHEIRKYKLLDLYGHSELLDDVVERWFKFYRILKHYKRCPSKRYKAVIWRLFNSICKEDMKLSTLNAQLKSTYKNRKKLLYVLNNPEVEIHNNLVETDLREKVIKRKISLFNRSIKGVKSWDLMLSLASTCRKNGISFYKYLADRYNNKGEISYLGQIIARS